MPILFFTSHNWRKFGEFIKKHYDLPLLNDEFEWIAEPNQVSAVHTNDQTGLEEILVSRKGLPKDEATWEVVSEVQKQFLSFNPWGQGFIAAEKWC